MINCNYVKVMKVFYAPRMEFGASSFVYVFVCLSVCASLCLSWEKL